MHKQQRAYIMDSLIYENQELNRMIQDLLKEILALKNRIDVLETEKAKNPVYSEFLVTLTENRALKDELQRETLEKNSIRQKLDIMMDSTKYLSIEIGSLQEKISAFPQDYHEMHRVIQDLRTENSAIRSQFQSELLNIEKQMYSLDFLDDFVSVHTSKMIGLEKIYLSDIFHRFIIKFQSLLDTEMGSDWKKMLSMQHINWIKEHRNEYLEAQINVSHAALAGHPYPSSQSETYSVKICLSEIYLIHRLFSFCDFTM